MRNLAFLSGTIFGAITVAAVLHDGFRDASKKLIETVTEQLSKSVDELNHKEEQHDETETH